MRDIVIAQLKDSAQAKLRAAETLPDATVEAAQAIIDSLRAGGTVAFCGNGGSAADAQHLAGEFIGRFKRERKAFAGIALTTDTSILTAIGNDYGFDQVFARQVEGLLRAGDVLVGFSTSGNAQDVLAAMRLAGQMGVRTIAFTGEGGGAMAREADLCLRAPHTDTPRIQEIHITLGHIICDLVESVLAGGA